MQAVEKAKAAAENSQAEAKALQPLKRGEIALHEFSNNAWRVVAPLGATAQELDQHPTFWNLIADELNAGDDVKVIAQDRSWIARFEVLDAGPGFASVKLAYSMAVPLRGVATAKQLPADWDIVRTGPNEPPGYVCVNRVNGKRILESGMPFPTHETARRGLLDHPIFRTETVTKYLP